MFISDMHVNEHGKHMRYMYNNRGMCICDVDPFAVHRIMWRRPKTQKCHMYPGKKWSNSSR